MLVASAPVWGANSSITFNGTTSKLQHDTASLVTGNTMTIVAWVYATGLGENSFGRAVVLDESESGVQVSHRDSSNQMSFAAAWASTSGVWTFTANDNQWNGIAIGYSKSATTNDPTGRIMANGGAAANISFTETSTPLGTAPAFNSGICIGNRTAADRTWAGRIAYVQVFNTVLSSGDMDAAMQNPGSITSGLVGYWKMQGAADVNDYSGNGNNATATSLADGADGPPYPAGGVPIIFRNWLNHSGIQPKREPIVRKPYIEPVAAKLLGSLAVAPKP